MSPLESRYHALIAEVARICDATLHPSFDQMAFPVQQVELSNIHFLLSSIGHSETPQLLVSCYLGSPRVSDREPAMLRLLQANAMLPRDPMMRFFIDPAGEGVVLEYALPLDRVTAQSVVAGMEEAVRHSPAWRHEYYLDSGNKSSLSQADIANFA